MTEAMADWRVLEPPNGRSYMDPCLFELGDRVYLFFENYSDRAGRGVISYVELADDGTPSEPHVALRREYHLSYPLVFSYEGSVYMIPETFELKAIGLYRADPFPDVWKPQKVLIDGIHASDATLFEHEGRLWLFVNIAVAGKASIQDELFLFWSDSLSGPWIEHPRNPIVADARSARPAGRIFACGGKLYRPAQDCSGRYGAAVVFNRIERLTPTDYAEMPCARLDGSWLPRNIGSHTYTAAGSWEAIDGRIRLPRIWKRRT